ncbi:peptidoglycan DD-metalloendopeptidase family protein [Oscillatoria acuminata]|uniref:Metalloendopeptidase-like membrane protein n=1 Tax=Oscillatoria acuminata PCC 6304 TaxID=56110 RepID=K9TBE3_9CYAN|nr:peptidoglycan DD-metalloendopeptidase family protein [Oscillatoria acuminata]AFY80217.1 metalloendopeptidase-like membrane protein [Oscillatoria acuminata PCC 6304]
MNIQQLAIGTLAAIVTADLTQEASVSPNAGSRALASPGSNEVRDPHPLGEDALQHYAVLIPGDRDKMLDPSLNDFNPSDLTLRASFVPPMPLTDLEGHWAKEFIEVLQAQGIILGFPDGSFQPDAAMTQAQFATVLQRAFQDRYLPQDERLSAEVLEDGWAQTAIAVASEMGWMGGEPNQGFEPNQPIPRLQVLVALVNGLNLKPPRDILGNVETYFSSSSASIPPYAQEPLAGAILLLQKLEQHGQIYGGTTPNDWFSNPDRIATRGEVAAFIYQALAIVEAESSGTEVPTVSRSQSFTPTGESPEITTSLFPPLPAESVVTLFPQSPDTAEGPEDSLDNFHQSDRPAVESRFSLPSNRWGIGGEGFAITSTSLEPSPDLNVQAVPTDETVPVGDRFQPTWEGPDRPSESLNALLPPRPVTPTPSETSVDPLENSISLRLETLRGRIQSTPSPVPELPPLAAASFYLPEPGELFQGYIWPARGVFTSGFGMRWGRMHKGIDIAGPIGTPIMAAATGIVTFAGWNSGGYGNLVEIEHPDGSLTRYAHNHRILVSAGQEVIQGQLIAEMGSTGNSTGPHLHFELYPPGTDAADPLAYLPGDRQKLRVDSTVGQAVYSR